MSMTISTKTYAQDSVQKDIAVYAGPANTFSVKDTLTLKRTAPKPTKDFAGVARASAKFTKTVSTGTLTTADAIVEVSVSLPVGMSEANVTSLEADLVSFVGLAAFHDLNWKQDILN